MDLHEEIALVGKEAKSAALEMVGLTAEMRTLALIAMAKALEEDKDAILKANAVDVAVARENGLSDALIDRLTITHTRFNAMVKGIFDVSKLEDPLTRKLETIERPNGLKIIKQPVPIGVIVVIFESRPNVTADAAALCIKSGNAAILRGGKEAINSNKAIASALRRGAEHFGLPKGAVQLIQSTDRAAVKELASLDTYVDLIIPRGGESLIRAVTAAATVPVLKHYNGICHIFVDESADMEMALEIIRNAKCQRPGTCNAVEKILVHSAIADRFIPRLAFSANEWGVELFGDAKAVSLAESIYPATEEDWHKEYLSLKLTVGVTDGVNEAIRHINHYSSHHSDAIITASCQNAQTFQIYVDSAAVYVNASTRFTDGGEFGFGCEMGISTDKLHARGPVGIRELTTYKYLIQGNGQIRS